MTEGMYTCHEEKNRNGLAASCRAATVHATTVQGVTAVAVCGQSCLCRVILFQLPVTFTVSRRRFEPCAPARGSRHLRLTLRTQSERSWRQKCLFLMLSSTLGFPFASWRGVNVKGIMFLEHTAVGHSGNIDHRAYSIFSK
eukprot:6174086-Pleurochrysis_carterae.AAC.5